MIYKKNKFNLGFQNHFVFMFLALLILASLFVFVIKDYTFGVLEEEIVGEQTVFKDGDIVDLNLNGVTLRAEIAKSKASRTRGLSGRSFLARDEAMLFIFDKPDIYPFWNKDTHIELDILWIKDRKIVYILEGLSSYDGKNAISHFPDQEANFVLELNSGFVKNNNVKIGDLVEF